MKVSIWKCAVSALALISLWSGAAIAAAVPVSLDLVVTSVDAGVTEVAVGDRFRLDFVIDDSITDIGDGVGSGRFPGLLTSFSVTPDPSNTGAWTPSGTYAPTASNFVTNAFGSSVTLQVHGTGYPNGGAGLTFHDFDLGFSWPPGITDNGIGDTFAAQLGGTFALPPAVIMGARIRFTDGTDFPSAVLQPVQAAPATIPTLQHSGLILLASLLAAIGTVTVTRRLSA